MGKRNTIHKLPEYSGMMQKKSGWNPCSTALFVFAVFLEIVFCFLKNESFDTIVGYVLVTIGLFALFALFFAVAVDAHL